MTGGEAQLSPLPEPQAHHVAEWLGREGHILFPALAIFVAVMLLAGLTHAFGNRELRSLEAEEIERELLSVLRRRPDGAAGDELSAATGLAPIKVLQALEGLQRLGKVETRSTDHRLVVWRMKR